MPATLQSRLRRVMKARSLTQSALARAARASKQTVSRWLADGEITMAPRFAFNLQRNLGISAEWLQLGIGPMSACVMARRIIEQCESRGWDS